MRAFATTEVNPGYDSRFDLNADVRIDSATGFIDERDAQRIDNEVNHHQRLLTILKKN